MMTFTDETLDIAGRNLVVRRSGWASGPAVVLLHPLGLNRRAFDALREALDPSWSVISYDQRGHGVRADDDEFELEHLVDDAVALCRSLASPVHLVGHALGGVVATLAAERVERALSLTVLAVPLKSQPAFAQRAERIESGMGVSVRAESLARWLEGLEAEPNYQFVAAYGRTSLESTSERGYANGWRALAAFGELDLASAGVPTLCIAAVDDASVPLASVVPLLASEAQASGRLRVEVLQKGGHMLPLMEPSLAAKLMESHWKQTQGST